jgi:hypothetical protein
MKWSYIASGKIDQNKLFNFITSYSSYEINNAVIVNLTGKIGPLFFGIGIKQNRQLILGADDTFVTNIS